MTRKKTIFLVERNSVSIQQPLKVQTTQPHLMLSLICALEHLLQRKLLLGRHLNKPYGGHMELNL